MLLKACLPGVHVVHKDGVTKQLESIWGLNESVSPLISKKPSNDVGGGLGGGGATAEYVR